MAAYNTYVGARYVPLIVGEWNSTLTYEPLSIVTYQGNSYTSKTFVPRDIDILDTTYWLLSGNYNAQVESYRQEVRDFTTAFEGEIMNLNGLVQTNTEGITALGTTVGELNTTVTTLSERLTTEIASVNQKIIDERQNVDVKKMGAKGDGLTDDSDVFISAFEGGNKIIFIPSGNYLITKQIPIFSNTTVQAYGTIICQFAPTDVSSTNRIGLFQSSTATNINIDGLKIKGTGALADEFKFVACMRFNQCSYVTVQNCSFNDVPYTDCLLFSKSTFCNASYNTINQFSNTAISYLNNCENGVVSGNTIIDCTNTTAADCYGIVLAGYESNTEPWPLGKNMVCTNNYVKTSFPFWEGIDCHCGVNIVVANNTVVGFKTGIGMVNPDFTAETVNIVVSSNTVTGPETNPYDLTMYGIIVVKSIGAVVVGNTVNRINLSKESEPNTCASFRASNCKSINFVGNIATYIGGNVFALEGVETFSVLSNTSNGSTARAVRFWTLPKSGLIQGNFFNGVSSLMSISNITNTDFSRRIYALNNRGLLQFEDTGTFQGFIPEWATPASITEVKCGSRGDRIFNYAADPGAVMGWACQTAGTETVPAVWIAMANFATGGN